MDDVEYGRRRRWSAEEKRAIVELSLDPECGVVEVARSFDVLPAQIYCRFRRSRPPIPGLSRPPGFGVQRAPVPG
jgi:transposase